MSNVLQVMGVAVFLLTSASIAGAGGQSVTPARSSAYSPQSHVQLARSEGECRKINAACRAGCRRGDNGCLTSCGEAMEHCMGE
jgi:hypothetical protein